MKTTNLIKLFLAVILLGLALGLLPPQTALAAACVSNGTGGGDWYTGSTWLAGCGAFGPVTGDSAQILSGDTVTMNGDLTGHSLAGITINTGGVLQTSASRDLNGNALTVNGTFRIQQGGYAFNGTFTYGSSGTLEFANTSGEFGLADGHVFWPSSSGPANLTVATGGLDMNSVTRTVAGLVQTSGALRDGDNLAIGASGTLRINNGGFVADATPEYTNGATLLYNSGGSYGRSQEWGTAGNERPYHVQISNSTAFNLPNGDTATARQTRGNLTIDSASSFALGALTGNLTITGNVTINGTLTLSTSTGDMFVGGNWTKSSGGTFTNNGSWVYFNGGVAQAITGQMSGSTNRFAKIVVQNSSTVTFNTGTGITSGLEVQAGSVFQSNGTADFEQELVGTAAVLDCLGVCTFENLIVRNVNANGTTASGTVDVNGDFTIATTTSSFTAPPAGAVFTIAGDFISNKTSGTFSANGGTITFNGSGVQNLTLASAHAFSALTVSSGSILVETQATDFASVTTLTNNGTVRRTKTVAAAGSVPFGLTGVSMNVDSISSSQSITVDRIDSDHPMAASGIAASSHRYWDISITGGTYQADITFADSTISLTGTQNTCRYPAGGPIWDCQQDDDGNHANASTTRNNVTAFSSWQNCVSCSPTAIGLRSFSAGRETLWLVWVGIGIVAGWVLLLRIRRSPVRAMAGVESPGCVIKRSEDG